MFKLSLLLLCTLTTCILCTSPPDARTVTFTFKNGEVWNATIPCDSDILDISMDAPKPHAEPSDIEIIMSWIVIIWLGTKIILGIMVYAIGIGALLVKLAGVALFVGIVIWMQCKKN